MLGLTTVQLFSSSNEGMSIEVPDLEVDYIEAPSLNFEKNFRGLICNKLIHFLNSKAFGASKFYSIICHLFTFQKIYYY